MKTCVFITGTNCTGKSTLARTLIEQYGGIEKATRLVTYCNDGFTAFGGDYSGSSQTGCGIDKFNETKILQTVVQEALKTREVVICEGVYLHTFGLNLTNAIFEAKRQLVVFLYAPIDVIHRRMLARSGRGITNKAIGQKQLGCASSLRKWASIGVPVMYFDTSKVSIPEVAEQVSNKISELCGKDMTRP